MKKMLIGVDEAGRGPLAGPVAVGVASVSLDFDWGQLEGVTDSKKMTPENREAIFGLTQKLKKEGVLDYAVAMVSAKVIDDMGIVPAIRKAMGRAFLRLDPSPAECIIKLDGGLQAPAHFVHQETIIKGDAKEKVIGLASVMAKVTRDRYMVRISAQPKCAPYGFKAHKGYGTKAHREAIKEHGLSPFHRKTFCRNLINNS